MNDAWLLSITNKNEKLDINMSYCFVCLFRADKSASGLAFRVPLLWKQLATEGEDVRLIINQSLYDKTLYNLERRLLNKVYIIPEPVDFRVTSLLCVPPILLYLFLIEKINKFHLSAGGAYFIDYLRLISKALYKEIIIHTSIGSKSLDMIVEGDLSSRYYKLHVNLMEKSDKIDCLYSPTGFPEYSYKCVQSPGSFSWKYNTNTIKGMDIGSCKSNDILFVGSLLSSKNYQLAIEGYKQLSKDSEVMRSLDYPRLIIIAPNIHEELKAEIDEFNKSSSGEILLESYNNIDDILQKSYLFLSLQDYDNYPSQSLIEAMVFGCTVIATDFGETRNIVKVENGNILIEKDVNELMDAIKNVLDRPHDKNEKNIKMILKNHTIENYAEYFKLNFLK
mgnify:CR=1 FL=1